MKCVKCNKETDKVVSNLFGDITEKYCKECWVAMGNKWPTDKDTSKEEAEKLSEEIERFAEESK